MDLTSQADMNMGKHAVNSVEEHNFLKGRNALLVVRCSSESGDVIAQE